MLARGFIQKHSIFPCIGKYLGSLLEVQSIKFYSPCFYLQIITSFPLHVNFNLGGVCMPLHLRQLKFAFRVFYANTKAQSAN